MVARPTLKTLMSGLSAARTPCAGTMTSCRQLLRHPVGGGGPPAVGAVVGDVIAVLDDQELDRAFHLARQAVGILTRDDAVEPPVHDEGRASDALRDALERQRRGMAPRIVRLGATAADAERLARQLRQAVPRLRPDEGPAQGHARLDALLEGGGARRIVAAEAHTPHADASSIEIAALLHGFDHRRHRDLVVAADGEVVLAFVLARPVE